MDPYLKKKILIGSIGIEIREDISLLAKEGLFLNQNIIP